MKDFILKSRAIWERIGGVGAGGFFPVAGGGFLPIGAGGFLPMGAGGFFPVGK